MNGEAHQDWCTKHRTSTGFHDAIVESCSHSLFVQRLPMAKDTAHYVFHLYVSSFIGNGAFNGHGSGPELALAEDRGPDTMPRRISAEEAREMAAALIRGAEIVEAGRTASCAACGSAAHPFDLFTEDGDVAERDGRCFTCVHETRVRERAERRSRLHCV